MNGYIEKYNLWLSSELVDDDTKRELEALSESEIKDRFYKDLTFGTGGLRGKMSAGSDRMNIYTVRRATQGLAKEILSHGTDFADKGVVIAYDSRNNSKLFAEEAARVLLANGIKVFMFPSLRTTPMLSFAVRYLGCARGVVITASHNPKEYNGYKVYSSDGGQITSETTDEITKHISKTHIFDDIKLCDKKPVFVGDEVDRAYVEAVTGESLSDVLPHSLKIVYTPLHGAACIPVEKILKSRGFNDIFVVPEQKLPNGDFPTVSSPNPENPEAFELGIKYAKAINADIIIGTDPDGDRLGVAVRNETGEYITLNGNQTGCILAEYILKKGSIPNNGAIIKTIVTTELIKEIADDYGVKTIDVLTGFKYIGEKIRDFEELGRAQEFIFGLEESFGYLKGTYARDKDAAVAAMLVCEAAAEYKKSGSSLYNALLGIYKKYGYYKESLETVTLEGADGAEKIRKLMELFRKGDMIDGAIAKIDYLGGIDGLPFSDVIKFILENGSVVIRPSGTEPKIKLYISVRAASEAEAESKIAEITDIFKKILVFVIA